MSKQRKFILIAAAIGVISMFLPWGKISFLGIVGGSYSGMDMQYSFLPLLCFVGAGVIAFLGNQTENIKTNLWFVSLICGAIATLYVVLKIINIPTGVSASFGIYLAALSGIGVLLAAFLLKSASDNLQGGFNSLKGDIESRMKSNQTTTTTNTTNPPGDTQPNKNPPM